MKRLLVLVVVAIFSFTVKANQENNNHGEQHVISQEQEVNDSNTHDQTSSHESDEEGFNAGHFILHHVMDSYEWHIIGNIAIPLPIIVYSKTNGFHIFSSKKVSHGHEYKGFTIAEHGENSGKLVEVISEHETQLPLLDLSFTKNVLAIVLSLILLMFIFIAAANRYKNNPTGKPRGIQSFIEPFVVFLRDEIAKPAIGEKKYMKFMPYLLSIFFFIWINNMLGLLPTFPGGANVTGNITVTLVLALCTFLITTFRGNKNYWTHIFNTPGVPWWLKVPIPLMPVIELAGIFIKPFVLMVRLFANISAGHIIALGFYSLIFVFGAMVPGKEWIGIAESPLSIVFTIFMFMLELLVAFIQAYVFTLLSAIYFGMATEEHH